MVKFYIKFNRQILKPYFSQMSGLILKQLIQSDFKQTKRDIACLNYQKHKIIKIGIIPMQMTSKVKLLNLSNNYLRQIQGIEQFPSLQTLYLTNNKIYQGKSIIALKDLLHLKKVFLKGNPFLDSPLDQSTLTLLGSFQTDLQSLHYLFYDSGRESLVKQYRRSKSQSRISLLKKSRNHQDNNVLTKKVQLNKSIQKRKVNARSSNMQEFIQQKHQSQEISKESINNNNLKQTSIFPKNQEEQLIKKQPNQVTPMRKRSKLNQFPAEKGQYAAVKKGRSSTYKGQFSARVNRITQANPKNKFQEQSTKLKPKNMTKSQIVSQQSFFGQSVIMKQNKPGVQKSSINQNMSSFRRSAQRQFQYQSDNLKINMQSDNADLNYPSIIQKQDQDSYQIQFDFISPKKLGNSKSKSNASQGSPSNQLRQITENYLRIEQDQITEKPSRGQDNQQDPALEQQTKRSIVGKQVKRIPQNPILISFEREILQVQNLEPITKTKHVGSLYEGTLSYLNQKDSSNAYNLISRHFNMAVGNSQVSSRGHSTSEVTENADKFQKFYYNSLTRLRPTFNLLYSPFSSLEVQEKDILLQELFKNHKQIFIQLIRQFYSRQKLQQELKNRILQQQSLRVRLLQIQHLQPQVQILKIKLRDSSKNEALKAAEILYISNENQILRRQLDQFQSILASRQKLITDVQIEYQKAKKMEFKKQQQLQKFKDQDQIEQKIIAARQKTLKNRYLRLIKKSSSHILQIKSFRQRTQSKRNIKQQANNFEIKVRTFRALKLNYTKAKKINQFINQRNKQTVSFYFNQIKIETHLGKLQRKVRCALSTSQVNVFLGLINKFYLGSKKYKQAKQINQIKLKRTIFQKGFKRYFNTSINKGHQLESKALIFFKIRNKKRIFFGLKNKFAEEKRSIKQKVLKTQMNVILKNSINLFVSIVRFQDKQQEKKHLLIKQNIIKPTEISRFYKLLNQNNRMCKNHFKKYNIAIIFRLKKVFLLFKKMRLRNNLRYSKLSKIIQKSTHCRRLNNLVNQFKRNRVQEELNKQKIHTFFGKFQQCLLQRRQISHKTSQMHKILGVIKGLKAKYNFMTNLRNLNARIKLKSRQGNLQQHYHIQQSKYKQGHQLNILTIEQLKDQIKGFIDEIQFSKIQIHKLSQRELFILEEKENCCLEARSIEEQNMQLRIAIMQSQKRLEQVERKYDKSLDMYAALMQQINHQQIQIEQSCLLYDTVDPNTTRSPITFRKQLRSPAYTTLGKMK